MHKETLSKENVLSEQRKDAFCSKQKIGNYAGKREFFLDDDGAIYRRRPADKHQLVIPKTLVQDIIKENHDKLYAAHPGVRRTHDLTALNYWWPGMRRSIEEYVRNVTLARGEKKTGSL